MMRLARWALLCTVVPVVGTSGANMEAHSLFYDTFSATAASASRQLAIPDEHRVLWPPPWTADVPSLEDLSQQSLASTIGADGSLQKDAVEVSLLSNDKEQASGRSSGILIIGLLLALILIRDHLLGSYFCGECDDLREHLIIASRNLSRARENWLTTASATINTADEAILSHRRHLRSHAEQVRLLGTAIVDHHYTRHAKLSYCRQCEDLREHLLIASLNARQHETEILRSAIVDHRRIRHIKRSYCRECDDLQEHRTIAARNLAFAGDSLIAAIALKRMADPEVRRLERQVEFLTEAVAYHHLVHQSRYQQPTLNTYRLAMP
jgi:hypothetical protein